MLAQAGPPCCVIWTLFLGSGAPGEGSHHPPALVDVGDLGEGAVLQPEGPVRRLLGQSRWAELARGQDPGVEGVDGQLGRGASVVSREPLGPTPPQGVGLPGEGCRRGRGLGHVSIGTWHLSCQRRDRIRPPSPQGPPAGRWWGSLLCLMQG